MLQNKQKMTSVGAQKNLRVKIKVDDSDKTKMRCFLRRNTYTRAETPGEYGRGKWRDAAFRLRFVLYVEEESTLRCRLASGNGERATLNYNPLRDTAKFAFKIKWA